MKLQKDKQKHLIAGLLISCLGLLHPILFVFVPIVAILKEYVYDYKLHRGTPDLHDIAYTIAGAFPIMYISTLI